MKERVALTEVLVISFQILSQLRTKIEELHKLEKTTENMQALTFNLDMFTVLNGAIHPAYDMVEELVPDALAFVTTECQSNLEFVRKYKSEGVICDCTYCTSQRIAKKDENESL